MDVASLYTNIPHDDGIRSVMSAYDESAFDKPFHSSTLAAILKLILQINNFEFNSTLYVQVSGTSMATKMGPNYAYIVMGHLENRFRDTCPLKPLHYKRFIDHIFLTWHHTEAELLSFIADFNNVHPSTSFSPAYSYSSISFLNARVRLADNKLITKLYRKPTDKHRYLHFESSHVKHNKASIPYSQVLSFKRLRSADTDFRGNCEKIREAVAGQKYPP